MVPNYPLQLFIVKKHKNAKNSTSKGREKNKHRFGILRILENILMYIRLNLKPVNFYLMKLAADFY
jgi:hypothetical protein